MNFKKTFLITAIMCSITVLFSCSSNSTDPDGDKPPVSALNKFEPPDGDCLFILGQSDEQQMDAYMAEVKDTPVPAGFAFYTSLSGRAVQTDMPRYKTYLDKFPNSTLQLAIWTGERQWGDPGYYLENITRGLHDANINALADACKSFGKPIFIRLGYEFDGWHNAYPPYMYIDAYKHFVDLMRSRGVTNVAYVWHSWGVGAYYGRDDFPDFYPALPPGTELTQELWYPGDEYVDWVAMSVFGTGWGNLRTNTTVQWLINFAVEHNKPVMLAETAAIKTSGQSDPSWVIPNTTWFVNVFDLCKTNNAVKAFTYINVDWEADNPASTWGDTRIQAAASTVMPFWLQNINPFLHADTNLYSLIKYP